MLYEVENISFAYRDAKVIDDLSFSIKKGKFYGILGPNGSGKTTLIDILSGFISVKKGRITFYNKPLNRYKPEALAVKIALVPQNNNFNFQYTVEQAVLMGRHPHIGRFSRPSENDYLIAEKAMNSADIFHLRRKKITELSGGEMQRTLFARAVAQDTPVLLLDESTSNMDIEHSIAMLDVVKDFVLKEGKTIISVFHDINLAALYCDYFIFIKNGMLKVQGRVDEVFNKETIKEVFEIESWIEFNEFSNARQVSFRRGHYA